MLRFILLLTFCFGTSKVFATDCGSVLEGYLVAPNVTTEGLTAEHSRLQTQMAQKIRDLLPKFQTTSSQELEAALLKSLTTGADLSQFFVRLRVSGEIDQRPELQVLRQQLGGQFMPPPEHFELLRVT